ncbi:carboxypeptidase-like regulatory domain-containing protein [Chondrinema litorale]|uniref:carboxypeptidase-like regulatory domain-containing protein n=1 Tax=Chondrinema litorale TaxID=2994555 RepID=UPI002542C767|nr:carboxypeptidase-like regulatory domain-containing protein [Chondrinema litorale]UZR92957.1 carboxypeptidase-like regulatory domain-containing protein [Chondrinema litorale]
MRLSIFIIFFLVYRFAVAQQDVLDERVTLSYKSVPLKTVLNELDSAYSINFSYFDDSQLDKNVSLDLQGETLANALAKLFEETGLSYMIKGNHVVLKKKLEKMLIEGKIIDKDTNEPISLATVSIKGKPVGIVSKPDGQFGLLIPSDYNNDTLYISMLGYKNYEFSLADLNKEHPLNVALETEDKMLREVMIFSDAGNWEKLETKATNKLSQRSAMGFRSFVTLASLDIPATDLTLLDLRCGTGILNITEGKGDNIKVDAEILTASLNEKETLKFIKRYLDLTYKMSGDTVFVRSFFNLESQKNKNKFPLGDFLGTPGSKINLKVKVPKGLSLKVIDGSGSIRIENLNNDVYLYDGSGPLTVKGVNGNLEIIDGSGNLNVADIKGNVLLKDHSGMIDVKHVKGSVYIRDRSGGMYLNDIHSSDSVTLTVKDNSGKVYVRDVGGKAKIIDTSGGIDIRDVSGEVIIDDRSGGIDAYGIQENLSVKDRSGQINTNKESFKKRKKDN